MNYEQMLEFVVRPACHELGAHSVAAEQLLMGTMAVESNGEYISQIGSGIARGLFQMEPATHKDIYENYLVYRENYMEVATGLLSCTEFDKMQETNGDSGAMDEFFKYVADNSLRCNLLYQAVMCRIHYLRVSAPLPPANDLSSLAAYWKQYYNTHLGAGTEQKFIDAFPSGIWDMK